MRILEVMESTIGGARRHLVDLAGGLLEAGDELHLCVAAERAPGFREDLAALVARGAVVHELPMGRAISPVTDWRHFRALVRIVREVRPDVVHTHSSKAGVLGRLAASRAGCRATVHTPHTFAFLFDAMFSANKRRLFRAIETRLARRTTRLIAVSAGEASTMVTAGVVAQERVRVVPNGVDPTKWAGATPVSAQDLGLPAGSRTILVAGLLNPAKGQDLAIEALALEPLRSLPDVHLLLAGHGDDLPALRAQTAAAGLAERVHFLGWREDLPALMTSADVLLLPSRWEGMPYAVLEAMAAGLPVVATRVDGASDLVVPGETGALVDVGDAAGMAQALAELFALGAERLHALGARGRERVLAGYTIQHMVAATRAVLREARDEASESSGAVD